MSINGIIFLVAFILMIGLIIFVICEMMRDRKKGIMYINVPPNVPPTIGASPSYVPLGKKYPRLFMFFVGLAAILIGILLYGYWDSAFPPNSIGGSPLASESQSVGLVLMGVWLVYRAIKGH